MLPQIGFGLLRIPSESHLLIVAASRVARLTLSELMGLLCLLIFQRLYVTL